VFGRDNNGTFILTDKSGFSAKTYDGKAKSKKELQQMLMNRNASLDDSRQQFIKNMGDIFDEYQKATPKDFRGFLAGDLMYYNTPSVEGSEYVIQPNVVKYRIDVNSKLGKRIGQSKTGVVVHNYLGKQYKSAADAAKAIQGKEVLCMPPTHVAASPNLSMDPINRLEAFARKYSDEILDMFKPDTLKGVADIHVLMYRYINNKVDVGLDNLGRDFSEWLNTQNLSDAKKLKISKYMQQHKKGIKVLWTIISHVMKIKDHIIQDFNKHPGSVTQTVNGDPGGEGYVVNHPDGPVKLVSRSTFTAANRAHHR
jgi:hypothetical protein